MKIINDYLSLKRNAPYYEQLATEINKLPIRERCIFIPVEERSIFTVRVDISKAKKAGLINGEVTTRIAWKRDKQGKKQQRGVKIWLTSKYEARDNRQA